MAAGVVRDRSNARPENRLGRYQLVAPLGHGGMGTIHLAVAGGLADFRKLLVVKELRQDLSANQRFVAMFLDEARLAARLNHPNVVQTIEAGQEGDRYFLSMEFLDGQPYSAIWNGAGQVPQVSLPIRLKILCDALAGLHYAHSLTEYDGARLNIVHRDVSPQNIFVTYDGQVKVVDFGIAKASVSSAFTSPGVFKGKFGYAAPEQVRGEEVDARTDVFAMGVILWEALTMQRFCEGQADRTSVGDRLAGREPRAASFLPKVDPRLAAICDRALAIDPSHRFASAEAFRAALDAYLAQSGQRVEHSAIQKVLLIKFAAERRTVHQLIDRHLKHGDVEESHVSEVALGTEAGDNNPTQVADFSKFVGNGNETIVSDVASEFVQAAQARSASSASSKSSGRTMLVVGVAATAAVGLVLGYMSLSPKLLQPGATEAVPPAATQAASTATTSAPPSASGAAVVHPTPAPSDRGAGPALGEAAPYAPVRGADGETASPDEPTRQAGHDDGVRSPDRSGSRRAVARPRAVVAARPTVEKTATPSAEPAAPHVEPVAPKPAPESGVGSDLNRMGRSDQRRALDLNL